ncbi:MAG: hypothetical protein AB8B86_13315 [Pseudomonadales bacterium]
MLTIDMANELDSQWRDTIELEVALNLPPFEEQRHYEVRFLQLDLQANAQVGFLCEILTKEDGREVANVKVSARDGGFAIRQCLQRTRRDMKRRSIFGDRATKAQGAYKREWQFS